MQVVKEIKTIKKSTEVKLKEKNSVFIGNAYFISSDNEVQSILGMVKKKFFDANHHCYAYKLSNDNFKFSDDGEPNGTAGKRILNAIEHFNLRNCLVVVTRYFGGTKLGVGPLGKTYYSTALQTLNSSELIIHKPYYIVKINCDFVFLNLLHRFIAKYDCNVIETKYEENVKFTFYINANDKDLFFSEIIEASNGKIEISAKDDVIFL